METKTIDVREAQAHLADLISLVAAGTEIILTEDSTPVAKMIPLGGTATLRVAGLHAGAIWTSDDFDEPLREEFWMRSP